MALALAAGLVLPLLIGQQSAAADPIVANPGFEDAAQGTSIPHWTQTFGVGATGMSFGISSTTAFSGAQSLLLDDQNTTSALGLESERFPVEAGTSYSAQSMMNVERGVLALYFRFFDSAGTKVGESASWLGVTGGEWQENATSATIPANAVTGSILAYSSGAGNGRGYVDDIRITPNELGTLQNLGTVVTGKITEDADTGTEDGIPVIYTVIKGRGDTPTAFLVADARTRNVIRTIPLPGVESAWGVQVATDGTVYIGTHYDGSLYKYSPQDKSLVKLGRLGSESHIFSMVAGSDGKIYAGTYPSAHVYEYDPATGLITDLGRFDPTERYVRSLAFDAQRGTLYVGVGGTRSRIVKVSADGTRKELLASLLPDGGASHSMPYGMTYVADRLVVKFSDGSLMVVRPDDSREYYAPDGPDIHSERVVEIPGQPTKFMFTVNQDIWTYDTATATPTLVADLDEGQNFHDGAFFDLQDPNWPGLTLVAPSKLGTVLYHNLSTGKTELQDINYAGAPTLIQSIHQGPDSKMWMAGYMSGFASYDSMTGTKSESVPLGQIESSIVRNGHMILGAYAGGRILDFDPTQPFSKTNPRELFNLRAFGQDRPFGMAYAPDRDQLFVGTVANTTSLQGSLAMYDFATGKVDVFTNLAINQSIVSVAYHNGLVYLGTTVYGGLGTPGPSETNAKLIVFDPATKTKVFETIPATGRKGVTGLTVGPDGMIWGVAEDYLFTFDPSTRLYAYRSAILGRRYGSGTTWAFASLQVGEDGNVYGTTRSQFFMVRPETKEYLRIADGGAYYLNRDRLGNMYYSNGSDLWKYTPPATTSSLANAVDTLVVSGEIDNRSIAGELKSKLSEQDIQGFRDLARAQRGKHIRAEAADFLIRGADSILR